MAQTQFSAFWHNGRVALFLLMAGLLFSQGAAAQSFVTNGSATPASGGCYQLTPDQPGQAGSIFSSAPIDLNVPFFFSMRFNFGCKDGNGADGIVFALAQTNTALGAGGGGLGYLGITPSIAIEWDDYQNGGYSDPASDHMAIMQNGSLDHGSANNLAGPITLPNIEDCNDHCMTMSWTPSSQTLSSTIDGTPITWSGDIINNIFGGNSNVYYGFTSGTGSLSNLHMVCFGSPQVVPMPDVQVCPGESVQLQADPAGIGYFWAPHPTLSNLTISNPIATPNNTTIYSVTITYPCGQTGVDNVQVTVLQPPVATATSNHPVCVGETLQLSASGGTGYSWSGPVGFTSNQQNPSIPNVDFSNAGFYSVTVTGANGCTATASTNVVVFPPPVVAIVPPPFAFCENAGPQTLTSVPAGGTWGGVANAAGQVNPTALGPGIYLVTYTATNQNGCTGTDEIFIEVAALPVVTITPAGPFCDSDTPQTLIATPSNGIWGGAANPQGQVDPAALGAGSHLVTYTYIDGNNCSASDSIMVVIVTGPAVTLPAAGPYCVSDGPDTLTATPSGGTWGGAVNAAGVIDPAATGAGNHVVTYTYTAPAGCTSADSIIIVVNALPTANISGSGTLCSGSGGAIPLAITTTGAGPLEVTYAIDSVVQGTLTVPPGTTTLPATTGGTYTIFDVMDANDCFNTGTGSAEITVVGTPAVTGFGTQCDSTSTVYTVTFQITGGDTATYAVTGSAGTLTGSPPFIFTSDPIASGAGYAFEIFDGNGCDTVVLSGSFSCECLTDAGTMSSAPLAACVGDSVLATHNGDEFLDGNDALIFLLHSGNGNDIGNVFATSTTLQFGFVPPMMPGVTYYISAVAGDDDGMGGVDLNDPCLSVSFGQPVVFNALPTAAIASDAEICLGEQAPISFALTGNAPFNVTYSDGGQQYTLNNIFNGHTIGVSPAQTTAYTLVSVSGSSIPACTAPAADTVTITVWPQATTNLTAEICQGGSLFLGGAFQTQSGTYTDSLQTIHGCDSILLTALTVNPVDSTFLTNTSCNPANVGTTYQLLVNGFGCDSVVVLTTTFSSTDTTWVNSTTCAPAGAGIFTNTYLTPEGCDSVVVELVILLPSDTTHLSVASCNPAEVGISTNILSNAWGCDSLVITTTAFAPLDTTYLSGTTCDPGMAGIFTGTYVTPEGCDSVVVETVDLLPSDTTLLFDTSCDPNNTGIFTQILTNVWGCDSTVVTAVSFAVSDTTLLSSATCNPLLSGVFVANLLSADGCDSIVIETVSLLPTDTTLLISTTCDPGSAGVFMQMLTNVWGCDSTVIETVELLPSDTTLLFATSCEPLDTGVAVVVLSNQYGCDSTIITATSLLPPQACGVEASLTGSTIPCDETTGTLTLTATLGEAPFAYNFTGPATGNGILPATGVPEIIGGLPAGNYTVTVVSSNGLWTTAVAEIFQLAPPQVTMSAASDYNGYGVSCAGEMDGSAAATSSAGTPPYTWLWSNGNATATATGLAAGVYGVTVTDANGCTDSGTVLLAEPPPFQFSFVVNNLDCFGQSDGVITVVAKGGAEPYTYSLDGGTFQTSPSFAGLTAGTFEVTAQDDNGCTASEIIWVSAPIPVVVELGSSQSIDAGDGTTLTAIVNLPYDSLATITWSGLDTVECPTCLTQPVAPLLTTTYAIEITAENGCQDADAVTVFVDRRKHVYIPNAFSPNNDGTNDVFQIFAKPNTVAQVKSFLVFSRWGETVWQYYFFEPNNPAYGWNGTYRGQEMNSAVFTWFAEIEFTDGTTELFKGDVTLVR
ncbi:MAG: T9SS type B sorting domain-containing protein [Saprospiraceae bacterium]|nr:MAG: T9SS type B sorting domain-containing protein [Saprospiraceae bacterium]